jgi:hypothetical protein
VVTKRTVIVPRFGCVEHAYRAADRRIQRTVAKLLAAILSASVEVGRASRLRGAAQQIPTGAGVLHEWSAGRVECRWGSGRSLAAQRGSDKIERRFPAVKSWIEHL